MPHFLWHTAVPYDILLFFIFTQVHKVLFISLMFILYLKVNVINDFFFWQLVNIIISSNISMDIMWSLAGARTNPNSSTVLNPFKLSGSVFAH